MSIKYSVLPEEREQMQKDVVNHAITSMVGPVAFYETGPGGQPRLTLTDVALQAKQSFCKLVWEDKTRKLQCLDDHEDRASSFRQPGISLCWCGVHNAVCPVGNGDGESVTLTGGEFRLRERRAEAEEWLEQFLETVALEHRGTLRGAWHQLPEFGEAEVLNSKMHELELAGRSYLYALKRHSDLQYATLLTTHDVVIALQALIADIEVLKIELKEAFGIGQKWEKRFEALIQMCEEHNQYLRTRLELDRPKYEYDSIVKLIYECVDSYLPEAKARMIDIKVDLEQTEREGSDRKPILVRMDRINLRQALRNILDNAIKYSFSGTADHPRRINIVGQLQTVQGASGYSVLVSNLGIGIEADELHRVFERGYQGRRRLDESRSGHGMGLTFVKECIEKHGGTIALSSQPQQRTAWLTSVHIWLPLQGPTVQRRKEA